MVMNIILLMFFANIWHKKLRVYCNSRYLQIDYKDVKLLYFTVKLKLIEIQSDLESSLILRQVAYSSTKYLPF